MLMLTNTGIAERGDSGRSSDALFTDADSSEIVNEVLGDPDDDNSPRAPYITVSIGESKHAVDYETFQKSQAAMDDAMTSATNDMAASLEALYTSIGESLRGETQKMLGVVKLLHEDSAKRVDHLIQRERRLEITMMHGQYGKCCCGTATSENTNGSESLPQCTWLMGPELLGKYSKKCDMDKHAYTEFLEAPEAGSLEDNMLDQCGQTPGWQKYTSNQIMNECDTFSSKLDRDIEGLSSYILHES